MVIKTIYGSRILFLLTNFCILMHYAFIFVRSIIIRQASLEKWVQPLSIMVKAVKKGKKDVQYNSLPIELKS